MKALLNASLNLKLQKCEFIAKEIGFVGFSIALNEVCIEKDSIATIEEWPMLGSQCDI
jgi:hypothetical protein